MRLNDLKAQDFVTVTEAAEMLRVSKMTVYRLIEKGVIGCVMVGRSYRIPSGDLTAYVERRRPLAQ